MDLQGLPGGDLIGQGLRDLGAGNLTASALLVLVGAPRLRLLGLAVPQPDDLAGYPEDRLYELLAQSDQDSAHSRYNAMVRTLVSFERALACEGL